MRRYNHVGHGDQPDQHIVFNDAVRPVLIEQLRLLFIDVQTRRADFTALESVNERFRVDQSASGGIDDHDARLHPGNGGSADHVPRLAGKRAVERDHI